MSDRVRTPSSPSTVSSAAGFADVASIDQVPPGSNLRATVGDIDITVVNAGGSVFAVSDLCMRCGASLAAAAQHGARLDCRGCGWQYDLVQGCLVGLPSLRLQMYEVKVDDGRICIAAERLRKG